MSNGRKREGTVCDDINLVVKVGTSRYCTAGTLASSESNELLTCITKSLGKRSVINGGGSPEHTDEAMREHSSTDTFSLWDLTKAMHCFLTADASEPSLTLGTTRRMSLL